MNFEDIKAVLAIELTCVKSEVIESLAAKIAPAQSNEVSKIKSEYQTELEANFTYPDPDNVEWWTAGEFAKNFGDSMRGHGNLHRYVESQLSKLGFRPSYTKKYSDQNCYPCNSPLIQRIVREYFERKSTETNQDLDNEL